MNDGTHHRNLRTTPSADGGRPESPGLQAISRRLAHTIRNPLSTIHSAAQLILRLNLDAEHGEPHLRSILTETERINNVVRTMEDYVRLETGPFTEVNLPELAEETIKQAMGGQANEVSPQLSAPHGQLVVSTDPSLLGRAIRELVDNAIAEAPHGTDVTVRIERLPDLCATGIMVEDRGPGISPSIAERMMVPFYSSRRENIGLGLNIVQRICTLLGARLSWCNRPDSGARFTLVLDSSQPGPPVGE